tara:strand:+ start:6370 stop:7509 length:1140 start_codon:yes stop_codon:yes gene_type:complete
MSAVQLHRTLPESSSVAYKPYQTVDFLLDARGRKLIKNSIRIEFDAAVVTTVGGAATVTNADNIKLENAIGGHAFFDSFSCETEKKGVLQNLQNYSRHCNMVSRATLCPDDLLSSQFVAEGRGPAEENGNYVLQYVSDNSYVAGQAEVAARQQPPAFSISPQICFNRQGGDDYSFDKNGFIRVSMILSPTNQAVFGGAAAAKDYTLANMALRYQTRADDGAQGAMLMKSYVNVVSSVQSTATTVSARVPSSQVNGVALSFIKQSNVNAVQPNSYQLESLPQWSTIEYLFNNTLQQYITYTIRDQSDAITKGLEALETAGHASVSMKTLKANQGNIMGLSFNEYVDLSQQKFTINFKVDSDTITLAPMDVFMYFSTLITM